MRLSAIFQRRKAAAKNLEELRVLVGKTVVLYFDWNYSDLSHEDAKKHYTAVIEDVIETGELNGMGIINLLNPLSLGGQLITRLIVAHRYTGDTLALLQNLPPEQKTLHVNIAQFKSGDTERTKDSSKLRVRDVKQIGVGGIRLDPDKPSERVSQ